MGLLGSYALAKGVMGVCDSTSKHQECQIELNNIEKLALKCSKEKEILNKKTTDAEKNKIKDLKEAYADLMGKYEQYEALDAFEIYLKTEDELLKAGKTSPLDGSE